MKRAKGFEVPFAVMRQIGTSMEDQLVSGFARVIRSGTYADGTALPGIRKLAVMFGVSEITVRNAVKRLCRDGLIAARPRIGLTVCAPNSRFWRGSILGIKAGSPGMYYVGVFEDAIANVLRRNGWQYSSVSVAQTESSPDFSQLDIMLDSSVDMAITFNASSSVASHVVKSGVRFVEFEPDKCSDRAALTVCGDSREALADLVVALKASGVKTVLFVYQHPSISRAYAQPLKEAGFKVRSMYIRPIRGPETHESVQRAGLLEFDRILSKGRIREDAVVCNDDYLAAGILSAFDRHGIRMPEDVKFATMSNKGLGPVHFKDLTRIELDPARFGTALGEAIVRHLETGKTLSVEEPGVVFQKGETVS